MGRVPHHRKTTVPWSFVQLQPKLYNNTTLPADRLSKMANIHLSTQRIITPGSCSDSSVAATTSTNVMKPGTLHYTYMYLHLRLESGVRESWITSLV
jgi:hypothetical protein